MRARQRWSKNNALGELCRGERFNYNRRELTEQEMELVQMHNQFCDNPDDEDSVFQKLLKACPNALEDLFDACLMCDGSGKRVILDFAPFSSSTASNACELNIIKQIFSKGKLDLLEHPIFELFILLKWARVHCLFKVSFFLLLLHMLAVLCFLLPRCGNIFTPDTCTTITRENILMTSFYVFVVSNSFLFVTQMAKLVALVQNIRCFYSTRPSFSILQDQAAMFDIAIHLHNTCTPVLGWITLAYPSRALAASLVLFASWHLLINLTMFPSIGVNTYMTTKVMRTVLGYFLAYSPLIVAFAIAFHILMPGSRAFGSGIWRMVR